MENEDSQLDFSIMEDFDRYVNEFIENAGVDSKKPESSLDELITADLPSLTSQECYDLAFKLTEYSMYVRSQLNENRARLNWCEDYLNYILSKDWNNYDPYTKAEIKRQQIITGNTFAEKLENLRSRLQARVTLLEDKVDDIRRMSNMANELGKKKGYEHN